MVVTLKDIAKAARVSKATVSYVINDKPGVSRETRERVRAIMKEMNFRPNAVARGLARQRTEMLGLVIPDITDMFYANIVRGVENKANELGFTLNLCTTHAIPERERNVVDLFTSGKVDGVILMTYFLDVSYLNLLKNRGVPFVAIDSPVADDSFYSVTVDNEEAGYMATKYLLDLRHKRIAFIHGTADAKDSEDRFAGYRRALMEYGIRPDANLVRWGDFKRATGYTAAIELLALVPRPTAIFAANDQMALGAMNAVLEYHLRVPEDISIIGVDDIEASSLIEPPLTTIRQPIYEMGSKAVEILLRLLEGEKPTPRKISLRTELVVRRSCAPAPNPS